MSNETDELYGRRQYDYDDRLTALEIALEQVLTGHEQREQAHLTELVETLKLGAFPDGVAAHRAAHQAMIDAAKQEAEFWRGLKVEIAKKSIWGILQILVILLGAGLAAKFGLGGIAAGAIK
jgi:hypothetical protein